MSERAVPFHCPFCGDEDLRPHGEVHGQWECRACLRAFTLKYLGTVRAPQPTRPDPATATATATAQRASR